MQQLAGKEGEKESMRSKMEQDLRYQSVLATLLDIEHNFNLWGALLVALGALFLLLAFPFYPILLIPVLALFCGALSYKYPPAGVIAGMFFTFPAIAYQSPGLAWLFAIPLTVALFEVFNEWAIIAFLEIVILAPFAPFPFSLISPLIYAAMALASLYVGSRRSVEISLPAVFLILLLSSFWMVQNSAFLPVSLEKYSGESLLQHANLPAVEAMSVVSGALSAIQSLFAVENVQFASFGVSKLLENTFVLFAHDTAFFQLAIWGIILYIIGWLPARLKMKKQKQLTQAVSALPLLLAPLAYFALSSFFGMSFDFLMPIYALLSIIIIVAFSRLNIKVAHESQVIRREKTKKFGKFGLQDLGEGEGVSSLDDIGGYEDVKAELRSAIIMPLEKKELSLKYGIKPPSGILLFGPPGTGKTLLMRALSKELDYGFYAVQCSELLSKWYGETEKNISELFDTARKNAPCILFFDEIDSIGKKRSEYSSDEVSKRVLSMFLEELDGSKSKKGVIIIGATNIPNQLDSALIRPGRLDKIIYMPLPDISARKAIFKVHTKKLPLSSDIDYERLTEITERYSGADIANICSEASRLAAGEAAESGKNKVVPVSMAHFSRVISSVRPSVSLEQLAEHEKFRLDFERRVAGKGEEEKEKEKKKKDAVSWSDVAGLKDVKQALREAIELPLLHEDVLKQYKIKPSKGLLMFGPPGCGKTLILKAASSEMKATFLTLSGAELTKRGYEYSVQAIRETFNRAREHTPAIIFLDEIESLASARSQSYSSPVLTQLLTELDGVSELKNVMLVGATNKPNLVDSAILRPGRFDKIIYVPPPDSESRAQIFRLNMEEFLQNASDADFKILSSHTDGFSGADISAICQEAKMALARKTIRGKEANLSSDAPKLSLKFSLDDILEVIRKRRPSITSAQLNEYMQFLRDYGERK